MANTQGMCKNCGSLIMFDNRDDMCECVFCNCVFPSEEAINLLSNPEGHEFKNEKFEQTSNSHHFTTRTYSTESLEKTIMREEVAKSNSEESSSNKEFEVSAKDVKAPKKVVRTLLVSSLAFIIVVVAISLPLYLSRKKTYKKVDAGVDAIVRKVIDDESMAYDYSISGLSCKTFKLVTDATINSGEAEALFADYCNLVSDSGSTSGVKVTVYYNGGIWEVVDGTAKEVVDVVEEAAETAETEENA